MTREECYKILDIPQNSTKDNIKSAYKILAKKWHPDINKEPHAEEEFKKVQKAYDQLINTPEKNNTQTYEDLNAAFKDFNFTGFVDNIIFDMMKNVNIRGNQQRVKSTIIEIEFDTLTDEEASNINNILHEKGFKAKHFSVRRYN